MTASALTSLLLLAAANIHSRRLNQVTDNVALAPAPAPAPPTPVPALATPASPTPASPTANPSMTMCWSLGSPASSFPGSINFKEDALLRSLRSSNSQEAELMTSLISDNLREEAKMRSMRSNSYQQAAILRYLKEQQGAWDQLQDHVWFDHGPDAEGQTLARPTAAPSMGQVGTGRSGWLMIFFIAL